MRHYGFALSMWLVGAAAFSVVSSAHAEDGKGVLTLGLDNDLFGAGTDQHYTHGTEITYVSDTYQPDWVKSFAGGIGLYDKGDDLRLVWALGQQMFTPADIKQRDLIVNDRPYAGWLYTSFGMVTDTQQQAGTRTINKFEIVVGVIGPESRAGQVQRTVHKWTGSTIAEGWDNQLHNETTVDVQFQREWIIPLAGNYIDLVPRVSGTLGTAERYAGTGITFRLGSGLDADVGPPLIRPSAAGSQYFKSGQRFYWYVFAGAHGRYVGQNIFLDGNSDGESHHVDKNHWVGEVQGGLVAGWENWRFAVTEIYRSREFKGQDQPDEFGSVAVSFRF